ncbi:hypothetical protein [Spiroplasma alleghenense]|uniref:Transmembrane protein n=1 Tax=Spiroplasma alleghenense TaxID=216931 RepID=A0A345Z3M7_9MOLU|nr:hypothetical protein [Spiroplasma alleghenense]AXK51206.1 hypothetical protein SALLE_v1c05320 [Spiroplasma alleghenense]
MNPRNYIYAKFIFTLFFLLNLITFVLGIIVSSKKDLSVQYIDNVRKTIFIFLGLIILLSISYIIILIIYKKKSDYKMVKIDKIYLWLVISLIVLVILFQVFFTSYYIINFQLNRIKIPSIVFLTLTLIISVLASILENFSRLNETIYWNRKKVLEEVKSAENKPKIKKNLNSKNLKETQIKNKENPFAIEEETVDD